LAMRISELIRAAALYELNEDQILEAVTLRKKLDLASLKKLTGHKVEELQPVIDALVAKGLLQQHRIAGMYVPTPEGKKKVLHSFSKDELTILKALVLGDSQSEAQLTARTKLRGVKAILQKLLPRRMVKQENFHASRVGWGVTWLAEELAEIAGWI
jgi:hypothetical protein